MQSLYSSFKPMTLKNRGGPKTTLFRDEETKTFPSPSFLSKMGKMPEKSLTMIDQT